MCSQFSDGSIQSRWRNWQNYQPTCCWTQISLVSSHGSWRNWRRTRPRKKIHRWKITPVVIWSNRKSFLNILFKRCLFKDSMPVKIMIISEWWLVNRNASLVNNWTQNTNPSGSSNASFRGLLMEYKNILHPQGQRQVLSFWGWPIRSWVTWIL